MGKLVDDLEMTRAPRARRCVALIGRLRWRSGAPGQSAALPFHKAHQANGRSLFGHIVDATANARRSASACLSACRGTPQACSGFLPAAFGSFVISQAPADGPIPAG